MQKLSTAVLALSLAVAATAAAQKPAASKAAPKPASGPIGTFTSVIAKSDIPATIPKGLADSIQGLWSLTFAAGKPVVVKNNGKEIVQAPATFSDGKMNLSADDTGSGKCSVAAVYTYSEKSGTLTFKNVGGDKCDGRAVILTAHPFKHVS